MNRNYKIKQISIPVYDDKDEPTAESILHDVVSIEKLKEYMQLPEGGTLVTEGLYFICFINMEGMPKLLRTFDVNSKDITVIKTEKHGQSSKSWRKNQANRRTN